jgi:hypothetical protein
MIWQRRPFPSIPRTTFTNRTVLIVGEALDRFMECLRKRIFLVHAAQSTNMEQADQVYHYQKFGLAKL